MIGITNLGKVNAFAMTALFILTLILCKVIFFDSGAIGMAADDSMTFGAAVELSVAMPLSWLPLIGDYTREAREPVKATAASAIAVSYTHLDVYKRQLLYFAIANTGFAGLSAIYYIPWALRNH